MRKHIRTTAILAVLTLSLTAILPAVSPKQRILVL